ncbi:MAG: Trk family potassium uptake protein [Clostridia bacterium]|nr:Trk family potassium uptake protein [Clostridia bacterium]
MLGKADNPEKKEENKETEVKLKRKSPFVKIIIGFALVAILGAVLLSLPISSHERVYTRFDEALFTSTSAVCVTGLVVKDTASYWSAFGQAIILVLIQIGGLGVITVAAAFALIARKRISIMQRSTIQEAISAPKIGGIVRLTLFILIMTVAFETIGAVAMMPEFIARFGGKGVWMAFFHSISAFCNAGFDVMGAETGNFSSLSGFASSPLINIVVMLLIVIGGIGYITWDDIRNNKLHFKRYTVQTKMILVTSAALIIVPAVFFFIFEFSDLAPGKRILVSLFQAVTPRTAGFNTVDLNEMTGAGRVIIIVLMLIGGSPGSTAGGMKTTTAAVLFCSMVSVFRRKHETGVFGRRIDPSVSHVAAAILMLYLTLFIGSGLVISTVEGLPVNVCLFETASAVGTVGLSLGITPGLGLASKLILIVLMFIGRVGGLTIIYAAISDRKDSSRLPLGKVTVG